MLPHFAHNGATRVDFNGSEWFWQRAAAAAILAGTPAFALERA
jgi:hypothetical protein